MQSEMAGYGVTTEPGLIERRTAQLLVGYGQFSFMAVDGDTQEAPASLFEQDLIAATVPDGLILNCGAADQTLVCTYESWSRTPDDALAAVNPDEAYLELVTTFSSDFLELWTLDDIDTNFPLGSSGTFRVHVLAKGRQASRAAHVAGEQGISGAETWHIRFVPNQ
jgi:hypothetical protein